MKEFSVPMALFDFIPVVFFFAGASLIGKDLKRHMNTLTRFMYGAGIILVTAAGAIKAAYKLLYATGAGDHVWMSGQFFTNQALGFLMAGIGLTIIVTGMEKEKSTDSVSIVIPVMALVGIMVIGLGAMDASLCSLANRSKKRSALVLFIVSFFLSLCMGYLSSKNFDSAFMNWAAEGINIAGQGLFLIGCLILHKTGVSNL